MYAKVFASIFDSSINECDPIVFKVWIFLLTAAQDGDGIVDMTPQTVARRSNLSLEETERALKILSDPDPMSRSSEHEGRRILPLPGRAYGWEIVTFKHWHDIHRSEDRRAYMRSYMAERRAQSTDSKHAVNSRKQSLARLADTASASPSTSPSGSGSKEKDSSCLTKAAKQKAFEERWEKYPKKDGRKDAHRHFFRTVRTSDDLAAFDRALGNYIAKTKNTKDRRYIKNGSTFFNNWQDEEHTKPAAEAVAESRDQGKEKFDDLQFSD